MKEFAPIVYAKIKENIEILEGDYSQEEKNTAQQRVDKYSSFLSDYPELIIPEENDFIEVLGQDGKTTGYEIMTGHIIQKGNPIKNIHRGLIEEIINFINEIEGTDCRLPKASELEEMYIRDEIFRKSLQDHGDWSNEVAYIFNDSKGTIHLYTDPFNIDIYDDYQHGVGGGTINAIGVPQNDIKGESITIKIPKSGFVTEFDEFGFPEVVQKDKPDTLPIFWDSLSVYRPITFAYDDNSGILHMKAGDDAYSGDNRKCWNENISFRLVRPAPEAE